MTSLSVSFGIGAVVISLITTIYLISKYRKGIPLSKLQTTALIIGLIADLAVLAGFVIANFPIISEGLGKIPLAVSLIFFVTVVIAFVLAKTLRSTSSNLDPKFKGLKIYYSNDADSPSIDRRPNRPYYIVNNDTNQAYHVPDFIAPYVQRCKIAWSTYRDKEELHSYFDSQGINKNLRDATDEELGLWFLPNRHLVAAEYKLEPEILERLKKRKAEAKFKDYQIIFLYPKYCWFFRFGKVEANAWPPNKRILVDYSTKKEAYAAPRESMDLYRNGIINIDVLTPRPLEDIPSWCRRKRDLTYKYRTFIVEELLEEHQ